jgi:preprotein translocase subunit SecG
MSLLFLILIIVVTVLLGLIVLVQNPKGGGLSDNIGGLSNQFMGVKQTTDVLEKGTWIFSGILVALCLFSTLLISKAPEQNNFIKEINTNATVPTAPTKQPALPVLPAPSNNK